MRRTAKTLCLAAGVVAAVMTPGVALGASTVTGTVTFDGKVPNLKPLTMDADPACAKKQSGPVPSEMLERQVYTKTMKGNKMVRKLLLWKTNKDNQPDFPAFVVYLTDFSPNRQNPLERDIKIASTEKDARQLFEALAKKNFIGGWEKIGK